MRLHLDLLVLLQRVWGIFGFMLATSLMILAAGVELALLQSSPASSSEHGGVVSVLLICAVILAMGASGALLVASGLRRHQGAVRRAALLLAIPNLVIVPFGTGLGVYTFWVLLNDDARREFGQRPRGPRAIAAIE